MTEVKAMITAANGAEVTGGGFEGGWSVSAAGGGDSGGGRQIYYTDRQTDGRAVNRIITGYDRCRYFK